MAGAQPDWYLGWIEGAMRLSPGINMHIGHWLIPELFFPAVLMPSIVFGGLYLYPFIEKFFSPDDGDHNVLRLPYEHPFNTALGTGLFMFMLVLLVGGGDDILAVAIGRSVIEIRTILRVLVLVLPPIAAALAYVICSRLRSRRITQATASAHETSPLEEIAAHCEEALQQVEGPMYLTTGTEETQVQPTEVHSTDFAASVIGEGK